MECSLTKIRIKKDKDERRFFRGWSLLSINEIYDFWIGSAYKNWNCFGRINQNLLGKYEIFFDKILYGFKFISVGLQWIREIICKILMFLFVLFIIVGVLLFWGVLLKIMKGEMAWFLKICLFQNRLICSRCFFGRGNSFLVKIEEMQRLNW